MARFAVPGQPVPGQLVNRHLGVAPLATPTGIGRHARRAFTHQGGLGYVPSDVHAALFNAAVSGLLADQFYESGQERVERLVEMVPKCDPRWLADFVRWLRKTANIRSAAIVLAAEYTRHFEGGRSVVEAACQRADEPGEMLAYWTSRYGHTIPKPIKRGVASAVRNLYTERSLLAWDGQGKAWRFGDVIEMVHPKPVDAKQAALFRFALDRRRHSIVAHPGKLPTVSASLMVEALPPSERTTAKLRQVVADPRVRFTWERAAGWLGRPLDAEAWDSLIPTMGYKALLRNLNNFDRAGLGPTACGIVERRLRDVNEVASSGLLPFQFLTAYRNLETDRFRQAVVDAAEHSLGSMPLWDDYTLILIDCSGSMNAAVGTGKSSNPLRRCDVAAFIAESLARRCQKARMYEYGETLRERPFKPHVPVITAAKLALHDMGGTHTWACARTAWRDLRPVQRRNGDNSVERPADRVIIITDEQSHDRDDGFIGVPVIAWNIAGYLPHHAKHGAANRYFVAGYNDTVLSMLPTIVAHGATGQWPWESGL